MQVPNIRNNTFNREDFDTNFYTFDIPEEKKSTEYKKPSVAKYAKQKPQRKANILFPSVPSASSSSPSLSASKEFTESENGQIVSKIMSTSTNLKVAFTQLFDSKAGDVRKQYVPS